MTDQDLHRLMSQARFNVNRTEAIEALCQEVVRARKALKDVQAAPNDVTLVEVIESYFTGASHV